MQKKPVFKLPWTPKQKAARSTFAAASQYALEVKRNPELVLKYKQRGEWRNRNFRHMAMRDYFNPPEIWDLHLGDYQANTGGLLAIDAHDDFEVVRVECVVTDASGTVVAAGQATLRDNHWEFAVPPPNNGAKPAASVIVTAYDWPEHGAMKRFELPQN
jgi:hypothetical protein